MRTSPSIEPVQSSVFSPQAGASHPRPSSSRRPSTERSRPKTCAGPREHRILSRSMSRPNMVTPEEYGSLPPSIQKKYFSSVERLRIAQQHDALKRKKQQHSPAFSKEACLLSKPSMDSIRPKTAHTFKPPALAQPRKSFSTPYRRSDADVDEQQALRFLALPEKVKRSHFTQEELVLLTESSERALGCPPTTSDEHSSRRVTFDRKGSVCSSAYHSSVSEDYHDMEKDRFEVEPAVYHSFEGRRGQYAELSKDIQDRRQDSVSSAFSTLPSMPSEKEESRAHSAPKPVSRKRAISLAPIPLPPPTLLPAVPPIPASKSVHNLHSESSTPPTEPTPSTRYYKDSEARQKLRDYLASPEKFDEALEFGFPTETGVPPQRSMPSHSNVESSLQTDIGSDKNSETGSKGDDEDNDDDDDDDRASARSPRTPSVVNEGFSETVGTYSSMDSGVELPFHSTAAKASARSVSPDFHGREMTLRMTLTRPDLRAPERELYAFQRTQVSGVDVETSDPLALEALTFCDDHTGAHGAFAVGKSSSGGFKKVWKNFRGRQ